MRLTKILILVALLFLLIVSFIVYNTFFSFMRTPTGSMTPTIPADSRFLFEKLSKPEPGDIIVFWLDESVQKVRYVKRLIAVGGQRVQIKGDCFVYLDGTALTDNAFNHPNHPSPERQCYTPGGQMQKEEWVVPSGKFFMLSPHFGTMNGYWGSAR